MKSVAMRALNWFISPALLLWLLPALMLLIAAGTVAQKYVGLYIAEKTYFSSFVFWAFDSLPLPGGYTLLGIFSLSLLLKFLLKSEWRRGRAGINLAHFGVVLLMAGGLVSSLMAQDGSMTIAEGASARQVHDYHQRDLMLVVGDQMLQAIPPSALAKGAVLRLAELGAQVEILDICRNCKISQREAVTEDLRSMARGMALSPAKPELNDEENVSGLTFRISGLDAASNGTYILFEGGPPAKLAAGDRFFELAYGKSQRSLPFTVELVDFVRVNYPGTDSAKAFYSDVVIHDGALSWPARIEMNAPLRYRGYTLYQSAFIDDGERQMTVLAVGKDAGQFIPYLGTLVLAFGLLLHLFIRRQGMQP